MADKKNEAKAERGISDVLSDLDGLSAELSDVIQLLNVYEEIADDDLRPIEREETWGGEYLVGRWPMHKATLSVIRIRLCEIMKGMESSVLCGIDSLRASKAAQN